jgi:nucleotide-binding universal stress UspA family protein
MLGPIVVPLDESSLAEQALPLATAVARRAGLALHLVTVHAAAAVPAGDGFEASYDPGWYAATRAGQRRYLEALAERVPKGIQTVVAVPEGPVIPSLLEYVDQHGAALVVMATHGRGGLNRLWIGSTLDRLIRETSVPVLIARASAEPGAKEPDFARMVIPLDGSELAEQVLAPAVGLGGLFGSAYELVRVVVAPDPIATPSVTPWVRVDEQDLEERIRSAEAYLGEAAGRLREAGGRSVTTRVIRAAGQPVADAVLQAAADSRADIVAMATHGRGGLRRFVLGSVADKMIRAAALPLLVVRPGGDVDGGG